MCGFRWNEVQARAGIDRWCRMQTGVYAAEWVDVYGIGGEARAGGSSSRFGGGRDEGSVMVGQAVLPMFE